MLRSIQGGSALREPQQEAASAEVKSMKEQVTALDVAVPGTSKATTQPIRNQNDVQHEGVSDDSGINGKSQGYVISLHLVK